jgi:hypothetical protein
VFFSMDFASRIAVVVVSGGLVAAHGVQRSGPSFPGAFVHAGAVRGDSAAHNCLSLGENSFVANVREVGPCRTLGLHRVGRAASREWWSGGCARRWLFGATDSVDEIEVVLFSSPVERAGANAPPVTLEPIWYYRYEADILRSVTPQVAPAGRTNVLIAIDECFNGTGGCSQSFATFERGQAHPVALVFLDSLNRRFPDGIQHGFHVDIQALRGSVGLYSANDPNCCPSMIGEFTLRLQNNALLLTALNLRPAK